MGSLIAFVLIPGSLVYFSFFVITYRILLQNDSIAIEAATNPFAPSFRCNASEVSRVEKGWSCLSLVLYRFREAEPYRLSNLDLLEGGPIRLLEELHKRFPGEKIFFRVTAAMSRFWRWCSILVGSALLLGALLISIILLDGGGFLAFASIDWNDVKSFLLVIILFPLIADLLILRRMNRDS